MTKHGKILVLSIVLLLVSFGARTMDEGMWLLDSLGKLPLDDMRKHGLTLSPEQIYNDHGTSLTDAVFLLDGGTASFISAEGLILTNHHVAFSGIQSLSSVQEDYLRDGFLAKTRTEELSTTYSVQIVIGMKDVTAQILSALSDTMSAELRMRAIRAKSSEIEKEAKGSTENVCRVSDIFSGLKYYLYTYQNINDVRLVYAPPSAIGNFGGEVDNWIWPRHTGDFSIMRAYVAPDGKPAKYSKDNVPFKPKVFLPISTQGYTEGSFAMILGFPGRTFRYREASAVELARDVTLPMTIDLYKTRMDIIDEAGKNDRGIEIKYSSRVRGLANTYKNYLGTLEGMRRAHLLSLKKKEEAEFAKYVGSSPQLTSAYGSVLPDLDKANAELKTFINKQLVLTSVNMGADIVRLAQRFRSYASTATTDSAHEKDRASLQTFIVSVFKNFETAVDKQTLAALIVKAAELPEDQQIEAFRDVTHGKSGPDLQHAAKDYVEDLFGESALGTPQGCNSLLTKDAESILSDRGVKLAVALEAEIAPMNARAEKINASLSRLRSKFIEAWVSWKHNELVYPDANRTIRFTYGTVKPFSPRDGVTYSYCTTLAGVIEKEQPEDPFIVPPKLKELWMQKDFGRYADPKLHDVPVAFIADMDITGGNSGSPVINGKGELIGCAFDGNWESVVGDYIFQDQYNRTISVDARYVLFVLDKFSGAENIMKELVIH